MSVTGDHPPLPGSGAKHVTVDQPCERVRRLRHAVVERIKEPDILAGVARRGGDAVESVRLPGEDRAEIDDRNLRGGGGVVAYAVFLEQVHALLQLVPNGL